MRNKGLRSRWWVWLGGSIGVAICMALGMWQLDRAAQKTQWQAAMQAQAMQPALDAVGVQVAMVQPAAQWVHRPVRLQGQWLAEHLVYLDNRQMQGQPGFYVLTALLLEDGAAVMVQRGWVGRNFHQRADTPAVETPTGLVQVQGVLAQGPARLWSLQEGDGVDPAMPHIRQNLDIQAYSATHQLPLWPLMVVEQGPDSQGLKRAWPQVHSKTATHYGYAAQWFAIAAVLAGMLLWFHWPRPRKKALHHVAQQP